MSEACYDINMICLPYLPRCNGSDPTAVSRISVLLRMSIGLRHHALLLSRQQQIIDGIPRPPYDYARKNHPHAVDNHEVEPKINNVILTITVPIVPLRGKVKNIAIQLPKTCEYHPHPFFWMILCNQIDNKKACRTFHKCSESFHGDDKIIPTSVS